MPCGAIAGGTGVGARRPTHATGARVSSVAGASGNPFASRGARGALRERRVLFITEFLCSLRGGWRGVGVPLLGSGRHALGEERGAWAPRKKVIVFLSIIHRDKDVITLAAIILKKFCDKKNTTLSLTQTSRTRRATRKKPLGLIIVSASAVSIRFCRSVDKRSLCAQLCKIF